MGQRHREGHRRNRRAVWVRVPRRLYDAAEREEAARITAEPGGSAWVMWGSWSRKYVAFGWWGAPPFETPDPAAMRNAVQKALG